ncbi:MAG: 5'-methylthioadenosine/adenosylhomocysteine nucleosidase [Prolixibacteraceae bacterium]|jgi:adenosylhomocysteine nucleosidase|nr:5'-methylthioadenosine/adenosylhomocysteine nucleosidase [Prolixibacteraceae bacterium]
MKTGLIGAMPQEILLFKNEIEGLHTQKAGPREFHSGKINGQEVVVCTSGWGKVAAASAATSLINLFGTDRILFVGLAGSLDPRLEIGDIVIAESLVQHDVDLSSLKGIGKMESPFWTDFHFPVKEEIRQKASKSAEMFVQNLQAKKYSNIEMKYSPRVYAGVIGSGDQFIASAEGKKRIRDKFPDMLCTEMEGAAIAQVAADYGVPFTAIRIISDKADEQASEVFVKFLLGNVACISVEIAKLFLSAPD